MKKGPMLPISTPNLNSTDHSEPNVRKVQPEGMGRRGAILAPCGQKMNNPSVCDRRKGPDGEW